MNKKKIIAILFVCMFCMLFSPIASYAEAEDVQSPQASEYIRSTSAVIVSNGGGELLLKNKLGATRIVDKLGIKTLEIQKKVNGYWRSIDTLATDDYLYGTGTYVFDCYYYVTPGVEYRSYVEFYVENDGGSETKIVTSEPVVAQ